ncbi:TPA: Lin1244/Lin1753 domain-containing protein [Enterococcus faecalis]
MARPLKQGIDYFPLSVDFLRDIKVRKIKRACGPYTVEILLCLLGNIYRETGYYIGWDEDTMFLVADEVGAKEGLVEETVNKAVQVGFFNQEKFNEYGILTSNGIQKRYLEATKKRKEVVISDIYLVNDTIKEEETLVNGVDNEQSKVNKSKVNKNNKEKPAVQLSSEKDFLENPLGDKKTAELIAYYSKNVSLATPVNMTNLAYDLKDFNGDLDLLKEAINICSNNVKTYAYFAGILKQWRANGINTHADFLKKVNKKSKQKNKRDSEPPLNDYSGLF